jgi:hypothetical protein
MPNKKFLTKHPVLRYRFILEMWKLAKLQRWAARHPVFSRWVKLKLDVAPEDNEATKCASVHRPLTTPCSACQA